MVSESVPSVYCYGCMVSESFPAVFCYGCMIPESVPAVLLWLYDFRECACSFFVTAIMMVSESVPAFFWFVMSIIMVSESVLAVVVFCYGCMISESVPAVLCYGYMVSERVPAAFCCYGYYGVRECACSFSSCFLFVFVMALWCQRECAVIATATSG